MNNTAVQKIDNKALPVTGSLDGAAIADYIKLNWKDIAHRMVKKETSKKTYVRVLKPFIDWLDVVHIDTVQDYADHVQQAKTYNHKTGQYDNISASYKRQRVEIVKLLFKRLYTHYRLLPFDIGESVKPQTVSNEHTKHGLSHDDVMRVKDYISEQDAPDRLRLNALLHLYALQALRSKEAVRIRVEDIDFSNSTARVDGKTGADQTIFLLPQTVQALRAYIEDAGIKSGYLFRNRSNSAKGNGHISERSARRIFTNIFKALKIERSVHGFRHYCITRLIELDFAFDEVMRYARIKDMNTIKKYNDRVNAKREAARIAEKLTL